MLNPVNFSSLRILWIRQTLPKKRMVLKLSLLGKRWW